MSRPNHGGTEGRLPRFMEGGDERSIATKEHARTEAAGRPEARSDKEAAALEAEIEQRLIRLNEWRRRLLAATRVQPLLAMLNDFGMTDEDVVAALPGNVSLRTVRRWRTESAPTTNVTARWQQLDDLRTIVGFLLSDGTLDEDGIVAWLRSRQRSLRLRRPLDLLGEGRFEDVLEAAERALGPSPSDDPIGPPRAVESHQRRSRSRARQAASEGERREIIRPSPDSSAG
jgi:hypothetical protein